MTIAANKTSPLLRALYRGRTDCYGSYNFDKGSHETVHEVLTEKNYEQHMSGQLFIGPYYLLDDSTCFLFSFDFDSPDFAPVKQVASLFMQRWGITATVATSRRKGYHMDFFLTEATPAAKLVAIMKGVKRVLGFELMKIDEFPAQSSIKQSGIGNFCAMPLSGHYGQHGRTFFVNPENETEKLSSVKVLVEAFKNRLSLAKIDAMLVDLEANGRLSLEEAAATGLFPEAKKKWSAECKVKAEARKAREASKVGDNWVAPGATQETVLAEQALVSGNDAAISEDFYEYAVARIRRDSLPCVGHMFHGVTEGCRDEVCFRLAIHFRKDFDFDQAMTFRVLREWNSRNSPSMPERDIERKVKNVYSGEGYSGYGCEKSLMLQFCSGICPLMSNERKVQEYAALINKFEFKTAKAANDKLSAERNAAANAADTQMPLPVADKLVPVMFPSQLIIEAAAAASEPPAEQVADAAAEMNTRAEAPKANTVLEKLIANEAPVPGTATVLEQLRDGSVTTSAMPSHADALNDDKLVNDLNIGGFSGVFAMGLNGFSLEYTKENPWPGQAQAGEVDANGNPVTHYLKIIVSKWTVKGSIITAATELQYDGFVVTQETVKFSAESSRIRLFKKLEKLPGYDRNTCDALMLEVIKRIDTLPNILTVIGTRTKGKAAPKVTQRLTTLPGGEQVLPELNGEIEAVDSTAFARSGTPADRKLAPGLDYIDGVMFICNKSLHRSQITRKNLVTGEDEIKIIEEARASITTSTGHVFWITSPGTSRKNNGMIPSTREVRRLPKPYSHILMPNINPQMYIENCNTWTQENHSSFLAAKKNDPNWTTPWTIRDNIEMLRNIIKRYVFFKNEHDYTVLALWIQGTYLFPIGRAYPFAHLHGMKGSGKSTVCTITKHCAWGSWYNVNPSDASMYRTIEALRSTMIMDEMENVAQGKMANGSSADQSMIQLLNASYQAGATIPRIDMDAGGIPVSFSPYGPKMIANINGCEGTIADRSIRLEMTKADYKDKRGLDIQELTGQEQNKSDWGDIRHKLLTWAATHCKEYEDRTNLPTLMISSGLLNRDREIWAPLFAIASLCADLGDTQTPHDVMEASKTSVCDKRRNSAEIPETRFLYSLQELIVENDPTRVEHIGSDKIKVYMWDVIEKMSDFEGHNQEHYMRTHPPKHFMTILHRLQIVAKDETFRRTSVSRTVKNRDTQNMEKKTTKTHAFVVDRRAAERAFGNNLTAPSEKAMLQR